MTRLPRALLWGVVVGVGEQVLIFQMRNAALVDGLLLAAVLVALLLQRRTIGRAGQLDQSAWPVASSAAAAAVAPEVRGRQRRALLLAAAGFTVLLPWTLTSSQLFVVITGACFAICGISLTVLTGAGGQLSLGQWAVSGIGAFATARAVLDFGWQPWAAVAVGVVAGMVASVVVGLPALRIRGLMLAVTTLAFAVAASSYLFNEQWFAGGRGGVEVVRPAFARTDKAFFFVVVAALVLAMGTARAATTGRLGRNIVAVRENEAAAAAFGVRVVATKLTTFAISGAIAGLAGAMFLYAQQYVTGQSFGVPLSLRVVVFTIVGGVGSLAGPLIGAALLVVAPGLVPGQALLASLAGGGTLLLILKRLPGGLATLPDRLLPLLSFATEAADPAAASDTAGLRAPGSASPPAPPVDAAVEAVAGVGR